jgi:glyoxylase-like metal-dependent hydrolase (beta-lactamase superfamily II)
MSNESISSKSRSVRKIAAVSILCSLLVAGALAARNTSASQHPVAAASLGAPRSSLAFEAVLDEPGPVRVETVRSARWEVPRSGLINLEHPASKAAGLKDGPEPIEVYFHALRHPTRGLFIVDSGVERALFGDPEHAVVSGLPRRLSGVDSMRVEIDLASWLARQEQPLAGVLLTHLHLDHVLGIPDVPFGTPIFSGPGEASARGFMNLFTQAITDRALAGQAPLLEWQFHPDAAGRFAGVLDIFGDGSVWALHVPGHTPGSTAYIARTPSGPVAIVGDACHTRFGWEHGVEPGTFSADKAESAASLGALEALAARHPALDIRLGHQSRDPQTASDAGTALRTTQ